jgi:pyruvate dehydrogenase (quinone)
MLDTFTKLKWAQTVSEADELEAAVKLWLAQPGPELLHVHVSPTQLVMPPFMAVEPAVVMALYTTRAILHGRAEMFGKW